MEGAKLIVPGCAILDKVVLNGAAIRKAASAKAETRPRREWLNLSEFTHTAGREHNNMHRAQPG